MPDAPTRQGRSIVGTLTLAGVLVAAALTFALGPRNTRQADARPLAVPTLPDDPAALAAFVAELEARHDDIVPGTEKSVRLGPAGAARFAIRPYPDHWIERVHWRDRALTLRPIRPEDEAQHLAFLERLDPQDIRLRIFHSRRSIERSELARLTQIDYDRELAFVAEASGPDGRPETLGAVRAVTDPDNVEAEFGIIVRSDLKGSGLGALLMDKLLRALREHGTRRVVATVLTENDRMRGLARRFGFVEGANAAEGVRAIALDLAPAAGAPP